MDFDAIEALDLPFPQIKKHVLTLPYKHFSEATFEHLELTNPFKLLSDHPLLKKLAGQALGPLDELSFVMKHIAKVAAECIYLGVREGARNHGCNMWAALLLNKYVRELTSLLECGGSSIVLTSTVREEFRQCKEMLNLLALDKIGDYELMYGRAGGEELERLFGGADEVLQVLRLRPDYNDRFEKEFRG